MADFKDKIVAITGGSDGIGKALVAQFLKLGAKVSTCARSQNKLDELSREFNSTDLMVFTADVSKQAACISFIENTVAKWGTIDILINNAGLAAGRDYFEEAKLDDWNEMIDTNIKGFLYVSQAVAKGMANRKKGHIINIGSTAGRVVYEKGNAYCATKYAVDALNQSMRIDLLRHGIKVTAINPGAAETEFSLVRFKGDQETAASVYNGMKPLTPEDVAAVIYYTTTLPAHVCINDLTLTCLQQADSVYIHRK